MNKAKLLKEDYKKAIAGHNANIRSARKAIRALKKISLTSHYLQTIKAYRKSIVWNRQMINECRQSMRMITINYSSNYWVWIILFALCGILALLFPISMFTFAPVWITLLVGLGYILIITSNR